MKKKFWIIGVGHFGIKAYEKLRRQEDSLITLVDPCSAPLVQICPDRDRLILQDGIDWLLENLDRQNRPDWIIPCLPLHLAAEWIYRKTERQLARINVPGTVDQQVPNPLRGVNTDLYASHATFQCPDNCPEPEKICTFTRRARKENMYDILTNVSMGGFMTIVLKSHQLAPGLGGIDPGQLFNALEQVNSSTANVFICTACRCHGVVSAFKKPYRAS